METALPIGPWAGVPLPAVFRPAQGTLEEGLCIVGALLVCCGVGIGRINNIDYLILIYTRLPASLGLVTRQRHDAEAIVGAGAPYSSSTGNDCGLYWR